jgi:penicillin amidase
MGKLWRSIGIMLALLLVLGSLLASGGYLYLQQRYPTYDGLITVPGLSTQVQVYRDRWGVPHIYAPDADDLFFAQGYVHAQDRLWQMEFQRRAGHGRLAEVLGESALGSDRFFRTLGLDRAAAKDWASLDETACAALQAYTAGVNAFLKSHRHRLPVEFVLLQYEPAPWEPLDSLVWGKMMAWNQGFNWPVELLRARLVDALGQDRATDLAPPYPDDAPLILPAGLSDYADLADAVLPDLLAGLSLGSEPGLGSNSWVVDGTLSASGQPLLANDPHLPLGLPSLWYEIGLHGDGYDVVGFSLPGVPAVVIGHNAQIAWGLTNALVDTQDLYLERLNPTDPQQYEYQGQWLALEVIHEQILVKDRSEPVTLQVRLTHHGPLLNEVLGGLKAPVALRWTGFDGSSLFQAVLHLNRAHDWASFRAALADWAAPPENFVYADVKGNIGYQLAGWVPIRAEGQGAVPAPGWTGDYEWLSDVPFDELPHTLNPPDHFIVTANNKIVRDDYPHFLSSEWAAPYRARRIVDLLSATDAHTPESFRAIQADVFARPAQTLTPYLLALEPQDWLQERVVRDLLRDWDHQLTAGSGAAAVYQVFYRQLVEAVFADELGASLFHDYLNYGDVHHPALERILTEADNPWFDDVTTPERERCDDVMKRAFAAALDELGRHHGDLHTNWHWGDLHPITFVHQPLGESDIAPLERLVNRGPYPASGSPFTINAQTFSFTAPFDVIQGPTCRQIVDLSDLDNSRSQVSTGQSGQPFHRHYADQIRPWLAVEPHPMLWARQVVEKAHVALLILQPE